MMRLEGHDSETSSSMNKPNLSYADDLSSSNVEVKENSYPVLEEHHDGNGPLSPIVSEKKTAKIHDFCFGIPFGGFVVTGGLLGCIFSRNFTTHGMGLLIGGAILALSTISLKVWRQGNTSLPFILGQAVLAAALLWKNFQTCTLTKKLFPSGLYALVSAGMLFFYSYVVLSGGNPPPKKLKSTANLAS